MRKALMASAYFGKLGKHCKYGIRKRGKGAGTTCRKHKPRRKRRSRRGCK